MQNGRYYLRHFIPHLSHTIKPQSYKNFSSFNDFCQDLQTRFEKFKCGHGVNFINILGATFFVQKCFAQFFSNYSLAWWLFGKRKSAQKLLVKCWWNWLMVDKIIIFDPMSQNFYSFPWNPKLDNQNESYLRHKMKHYMFYCFPCSLCLFLSTHFLLVSFLQHKNKFQCFGWTTFNYLLCLTTRNNVTFKSVPLKFFWEKKMLFYLFP